MNVIHLLGVRIDEKSNSILGKYLPIGSKNLHGGNQAAMPLQSRLKGGRVAPPPRWNRCA
jgi:hypothetical protein